MVIVINLLISYQIIHTKSKVRFSIYSSRANSDADRYKPREFASVHGLRLSSLALMPGQWVWETPPCGGVDLSHESQPQLYHIWIKTSVPAISSPFSEEWYIPRSGLSSITGGLVRFAISFPSRLTFCSNWSILACNLSTVSTDNQDTRGQGTEGVIEKLKPESESIVD